MSCEKCRDTKQVWLDDQLIECDDCKEKPYKLSDFDTACKVCGKPRLAMRVINGENVYGCNQFCELDPKVNKRMKFHIAHMTCANAYAQLSYCVRSKVGALLVSPENRPLLSGYNGSSAGTDNCCEESVRCSDCVDGKKEIPFGTFGDIQLIDCNKCLGTGKILVTKESTHHAERNLLGYANKYGIATNGCSIYVTLAPCIECSKQMELAGIKAVFYEKDYRIMDGITYLKSRGIHVEKITSN